MKAGKIIKDILTANTAVQAVISGRLYPLRVPETGSFPCVQYQQISTVPVNQKSGPAACDFARVQVNCYATLPKGANDLADLVRAALEAYSGTTTNGHYVHYIEFVSALEQAEDGAQFSGVYSVIMDFMIDYNG